MTRSVLVVDNSPLMFDAYRICLNSFPCDLSHARTGDEALRLASTKEFDLIFSELNLPGQSGFEVVKRLRAMKNTRNAPVFGVSAPADDRTLKLMRSAGFYAFFAKPLCHDRLTAAIAPFLMPEPVYATATGVSR